MPNNIGVFFFRGIDLHPKMEKGVGEMSNIHRENVYNHMYFCMYTHIFRFLCVYIYIYIYVIYIYICLYVQIASPFHPDSEVLFVDV